jgi:hypothetical protein
VITLPAVCCLLPAADYFHDSYNKRPENGGQRVVTVLMYLATPEEGACDTACLLCFPPWLGDCSASSRTCFLVKLLATHGNVGLQ